MCSELNCSVGRLLLAKRIQSAATLGGLVLCAACVTHPRLLEMPFEQAFDVDGDFRKGTLAWRVASEGQCCCSVLNHL